MAEPRLHSDFRVVFSRLESCFGLWKGHHGFDWYSPYDFRYRTLHCFSPPHSLGEYIKYAVMAESAQRHDIQITEVHVGDIKDIDLFQKDLQAKEQIEGAFLILFSLS